MITAFYPLFVAALMASAPAGAAPRVPSDAAEVLERLPTRRDDPAMADLRRLRAAVAAAPADAAAAAALAQRYFELASANGDPRYVGYAEAALLPWQAAQAPAGVLFARALLRQYRHDFAGALRDLGRALELEPSLAEARAWRAAIFMVQADYAAAARECAALSAGLQAVGCAAYVEATTGGTRDAYRRLAAALEREPATGRYTRLWALTRLAEMASRLDDDQAAERHFRDALALGVTDNFLLAAYADYLLQRGRAAEVLPLLKDWERSDTLLLRLALAGRALQRPDADRHARSLGERFAAAALRGEQLHLAEEARYYLDLQRDPKRALAAAAGNWQHQREPRDAMVLLEAALAAGDRAAAAPALRWLDETRYEDPRLRRVAERLR
jgi:hypothetical protein